jgi:hypothetical protein
MTVLIPFHPTARGQVWREKQRGGVKNNAEAEACSEREGKR